MKLKVNDVFCRNGNIYKILSIKDDRFNMVRHIKTLEGFDIEYIYAIDCAFEHKISEKFYLISRDIAPSKVIEPHKFNETKG